VSTTGWQATWQAYYQPADQQDHAPEIVTDPSGTLVYTNAACTPDTLYWESTTPVPVEAAGLVASPVFTAPDQPGHVFLVETLTDTSSDEPTIIRRGTCGAVSESAVVPAPPTPPAPLINTQAPADAAVGEMITDQTLLTGPYDQGTVIQWWVQHTGFIDPDAAYDELRCVQPDPNDMTGATLAGETILDHPIAEGVTETIYSPEFTSGQTGCTHIKERALTPSGEGDGPVVIAEGWFGQTTETTRWHPIAEATTGGSIRPAIGATKIAVLAVGGIVLVGTGVGVVLVVRKRRRGRARRAV
jgi:hypothetical protein